MAGDLVISPECAHFNETLMMEEAYVEACEYNFFFFFFFFFFLGCNLTKHFLIDKSMSE